MVLKKKLTKIDSSQNQDLSTSLERPYKELLNALIILEISHSSLILWAVKEKITFLQLDDYTPSHYIVDCF